MRTLFSAACGTQLRVFRDAAFRGFSSAMAGLVRVCACQEEIIYEII